MENNEVMLIYGFSKKDIDKIDKLTKANNLPRYILLEKSMANMTIRDILNGLNLRVFNNMDIPEDKVILFNNFTDKNLDKSITILRKNLKESPILAVVTPTSIEWTFKSLIEHLMEEREWFKSQKMK
ncbi:DUF3783 domain-containing protein [Clostridium lundense]|uniref:DUF3783 domain-containing protein n=1 Tax=Clostridium lundense TaxID=319475 RepID=UPI000480D1E7|nr:DUF3783 domain-containing protein [Clostridium lundense]